MKKNIFYFKKSLFAISLILLISCDEFLDVEYPAGEVPQDLIFKDDLSATSAVASLYSKLQESSFLAGNLMSIGVNFGLYTDELDYYSTPGGFLDFFYNHQVLADNSVVTNYWNSSYNTIYLCNAIIEGLDNSVYVSDSIRDQLYGESLFVRSLIYFYLMELFGDIPYTSTTDYTINRSLSRIPQSEVYQFIINDLEEAYFLLNSEYVSGERVRANKYAVSALLARIFLFREEWHTAEAYASEVINASDLYMLEDYLSRVFLTTSTSAILQLKQDQIQWTNEAGSFFFESGPPPLIALNPLLVSSFQEEDLRKEYWVKEITDGEQVWHRSNKYTRFDNPTLREYSTLLRLSEQFLIRAEARIKIGNMNGAADDLNVVRSRAGLPLVTSSDDLESLLIQERRLEFFCEYGHRWFDLKRWGLATEVLSPIKSNWRVEHLLLPIPDKEISLNPNLTQNPGY